jgi:hypothetical protein
MALRNSERTASRLVTLTTGDTLLDTPLDLLEAR